MKNALLLVIFIIATSFTALANELKIISKEGLISENPSLERQALVDSLVHQFDDHRASGITQDQLNLLWDDLDARQALRLVRFQIIDQQVHADSFDRDSYYFKPLLQYYQELARLYKINNVDFIIIAGDLILATERIQANKIIDAPLFMLSKNLDSVYEKGKFLLPDAHIIQQEKWGNLIPKIEESTKLNPWENKQEILFWRGGPTGSEAKNWYNISNIDKLPRAKLVMLSKLYPELINAEFSGFSGEFSDDEDGRNLKKLLKLLSPQDYQYFLETDHLQYKYIVALDGNTCPWVRVPWIMLSNSALAKEESDYIEWFYQALKPYVHYVPINRDLTDIFEKLEWMKSHDAQVKQISINAQNFIKNNLMPRNIEEQTVLILNEYSLLQQDTQIIANLPTADEVSNSTPPTKNKSSKTKIIESFKKRKNQLKNIFLNFTESI